MLKKMGKRGGHITVLAALTVWLMAVGAAQAKSYTINKVDITARLVPDGAMEVQESRTYDFTGSFSFAYRDMPLNGPVTFSDFSVSEGSRLYTRSDSKQPGTYSVERTAGRVRVTWYFRAEDQTRTFAFDYTAGNAVERFEDAAVLYYKFLAEDWDIAQDNIRVVVIPPPGVTGSMVNEWVHGPLWAYSTIRPDGLVTIECEHLPRRTYLEIRALYPPGAFPGVPERDERVRPAIEAEEARWAEEANQRRQAARERMEARRRRQGMGKWIVPAVSLLGLALWARVLTSYRHKPETGHVPSMASDIPGDTPPALVDYLLHDRRISGAGLVGTMLDLARRGYLSLREERVRKKRIFGGIKTVPEYYWDLNRERLRKDGDLAEFERDLLAFVFDDLAEGADSISLEDIKRSRRDFVRFFRGWTKTVQTRAGEEQWFDKRSIRGFHLSLLLGVVLMALAIPAGVLFGPWAVGFIGTGGAVLILSFTIPHRTRVGEALALRWKALQKYLKKYEFRKAGQSDLLAAMSGYLVYGVVLGLPNKIYEELAARVPEGQQGRYVPWYIYAGGGRGQFSPAAFGQAFSSMVATATSSMSTAAGTGGGASGGGGGGAGSGGGGAG
jgi:uncharacterized membrane protein YgcG